MNTETLLTNQSVEGAKFLRGLGGPRPLVAIEPDGGVTAATPRTIEATLKWIERNNRTAGAYFGVNPTRRPMEKKPAKADIARQEYAHAELDPPDHIKDAAEWRKAVRATVNALPYPPTYLWDSGNGVQCLWKLADPVRITDAATIAVCEATNLALLKEIVKACAANGVEVSTQGTHNIDRILRIPHTLNHPNKKKREAGRTVALAGNLESHPERTYSEFDLPTADFPLTAPAVEKAPIGAPEPPDDLEGLGLTDRLKEIITHGRVEGETKKKDDSRSVWRFEGMCGMLRAKLPDEVILGILLDGRWAIGEGLQEKPGGVEAAAVKEITRARAAVAKGLLDDFPRGDDDIEEPPSKIIQPSPFVCVRPQDIPQRRFLLRPNYVRKFLSLTTAIGGVGKSKLVMAELMAMATGRDLLGVVPEEDGLRCWYWNGEDPKDELQRQIQAIMLQFKIKPPELEGRLFVDSGRELPIKIAELHKGETRIAEPVIKQMIEAIRDKGIDVLAIDPFVSSHNASENDNVAMERVAKTWAHIADETNCSIQLVHHNRKTGGEAGTIEDARGATALNYAARARRAVNTMTTKQAKAALVLEDERRYYLSADNSNSNMIAPADALRWYKLVSVNLGNGPAGDGDRIGVVTPWAYPTLADFELSDVDKAVALAALTGGGPWRKDPQSGEWIGRAIAEALRFDLTTAEDVKGIKAAIAEWTAAGTLEEFEANDKYNRPKTFLKLTTSSDSNLHLLTPP